MLEDDPIHRQSAFEYSARNEDSTAMIRRWIRSDSNLRRTSDVLGSDEDAITSMIWGNLMWAIFVPEGPCYTHEHVNRLHVINNLERQMSANSKSPQGQFATDTQFGHGDPDSGLTLLRFVHHICLEIQSYRCNCERQCNPASPNDIHQRTGLETGPSIDSHPKH